MKLLAAIVLSTIAVTVVVASTAQASLQVYHRSFNHMTMHEKVSWLKKQIHKDKCVIRFWHNHPKAGTWMIKHEQVHWARTSLRIASHSLGKMVRVEAVSSFPPHHALWMCEHSLEAGDWHNEDTGRNGHYGGLQMHWNWGYGINGDPAHYSQLQQEWAAERGFIASGYSLAWLIGQWNHPSCLAYA